MSGKLLVFIPTFNEAENIHIMYRLLKSLELPIPFDILFLDDNSPDGTGDSIDELARQDSHVFTLHRAGKQGIGSAHQAGIQWAYDRGYAQLITMDCDLTHSPEYILDFYENSREASLVVGSRYLDEDSLATWNLFRKTITKFGHFLTKHLLRMPYDASGAFRLYNLSEIPQNTFSLIRSHSYSFFFESLLILHLNKVPIKEIAIKLPKRTYGNSKMNIKDAIISLKFLFRMFVKSHFQRSSLLNKNIKG
jgi:dolichol-phosphate mannosyltransferase